MYIVINCLGMPFNGDTVKEKSLGGSESAAYYMARELAKNHHVTLFTNHQQGGEFEGVRYIWAGDQTEECPLGNNFHFYAQNTPHDVLIIQRHPAAFHFNYASKVNLWWLHDLALLRGKADVHSMLWNIDAIITVSEFHKNQVCDTWEIDRDLVHPVINAVDESLFDVEVEKEDKALIYISRPERGLEHLVKPGGIMEKLPDHKLYVCGYDNVVPQMADYYNYLYGLCDDLPNVENLGYLTKSDLAKKMKSCQALVYPTPGPKSPNFEEVSCIAVMEAMHAGIDIVTSDAGALSETCAGSSAVLVPLKDGMPDLDLFAQVIESIPHVPHETAKKYVWPNACKQMEQVFTNRFLLKSPADVGRYLIDTSDIVALSHHESDDSFISISCKEEFAECYGFYVDGNYKDHYEQYYEYEKARGVDYGPEDLSNNLRYQHISNIIADLHDCSVVGDYGCAHGHYTINLAKQFPDKQFIGYDIAQSNIDKARAWAEQDGVSNVSFHVFNALEGEFSSDFSVDALLVCEVLEHVPDPRELVNSLSNLTQLFIASTPYGPWEESGYKEHWPWRAHLHHFDRADIQEMYGHLRNFNLSTVPSGSDRFGRQLGSFVYTFECNEDLGYVDYDRKLRELRPWQTLSLAMIVKDAGATIEQCLESCKGIIHEGVFGIDNTTTDSTRERIHSFCKKHHIPCKIFDIESPLSIGFDAARNRVISEASGSWIFWLDSDEMLVNGNNLPKYFRDNTYNGYALPQHHLSIDPPGVLKTDLPVKLFRNHRDIEFFGVVHEHPETALNEGVGRVFVLTDCSVGHIGYPSEGVRRGRFSRNIDLLERDRKEYPKRHLGKFLYIRDLAQMCSYDAESGRPVHRDEIKRRVETGIQLWLELFDSGHLRLVIDSMPYYSSLCKLGGDYINLSFNVDISENDTRLSKEHEITASFKSREHFDLLLNMILEEKSKHFGSKYG